MEQALKLHPTQKDVEYDRPTTAADLAKCTIKSEKTAGKTGWMVRDGSGQALRNFVDTNVDNVVDQWSYYKDGIEVYRDIDANFNGKADQCRWLNTAGTRWGFLASDDGKDTRVETWKTISAEEVTAELVAALREKDVQRFERLLLTPKELQSLGLGSTKTAEISKRLDAAIASFRELLTQQKIVGPETRWAYFGATRPGLVPAGTDDSQADLLVYENVSAMVETGGKHAQLPIGALVRVQDTWRLLDAPATTGDGSSDAETPLGIFIQGPLARRTDGPGSGRPSENMQQLMARLEKLDKTPATNADDLEKQNIERADILDGLAKDAEAANDTKQRAEWLRQLADTLSAATQSGAFPGGVERLKSLYEQIRKNPADAELAAFIQFRFMTAEYGESVRTNNDYQTIQAKWLKDLDGFLTANPGSADGPEAMLQLANGLELAGEEAKALKWYNELMAAAPKDSPIALKGNGAKTRLESVGKTIRLHGKSATGKGTVDLASYKGKVVLIHYWSAQYAACKVDIPLLQSLIAKYGKNFAVIGVSFDDNPQTLVAYLKQNNLSWEQIYEKGGLDSRLANEMGILTMPTMILVDKQGKVINRGTHAAELENELKSLNLGKGADREAAGRDAPRR